MHVPADIRSIVADGLSGVSAHPDHHYDWRHRRDLYQHMHDHYGQRGHEVHGWLAVITAEQVLPLFTSTFPDDPLPHQLVQCARQIMRKAIPPHSDAMNALEDEGYMATGIDCMTWRSVVAYNAEYAGNAAHKALMEARGAHDLLQATEQLIQGQEVQVFDLPENMMPDEVTDRDIAHLAAYSDTASAAAVAYACEQERYHLHADRLQAFWVWWVEVALREAWNRV